MLDLRAPASAGALEHSLDSGDQGGSIRSVRSSLAPVAHNTSTATRTIRFALDQASLVHLMGVLDNLYSDKVLAVIREYSTNAAVVHLAAGNPAPIRVPLPTSAVLFLTITDEGTGLSIDDLE